METQEGRSRGRWDQISNLKPEIALKALDGAPRERRCYSRDHMVFVLVTYLVAEMKYLMPKLKEGNIYLSYSLCGGFSP